MAFIPVPNTIEAEMRMFAAGQRIENTLYFQPTPANDDPSLASLGAALLVWWTTAYSLAVPVEVTLNEVYLTDLTTASSPTHTQPAPTPAPTGDRLGELLPNNATLCVSFRTNARGRSFRGRNYIAGLSVEDTGSSLVTPGLVAAVVDAYNELLAAPFAGDWTWGVVSRFANNAPRTTGVFTDITSVVVVDNVVDSQRRRLPGRGM